MKHILGQMRVLLCLLECSKVMLVQHLIRVTDSIGYSIRKLIENEDDLWVGTGKVNIHVGAIFGVLHSILLDTGAMV